MILQLTTRIVVAAATLSLSSQASADDFFELMPNPMNSYLDELVLDVGGAGSTKRRAVRGSAPKLKFVADAQLRQSAFADFVQSAGPAGRAELADVSEDELFTLMDGAMTSYDLSSRKLSDTTAVYLVEVLDAANGDLPTPSKRAMGRLSRQLARAYRASVEKEPKLRDIGLVQQQSDTFLLHAWLIASLHKTYQQPGADPRDAAAFQSAMRDLGQEVFGIDLTRATIDERGLTPGEVFDALDGAVREKRAKRAAADPAGEADRAVEAALGTPCGHAPSDTTERKVLRLFETRGLCAQYDPARYDAFEAEVPQGQRYAINFMAWSTGKPLYPAGQAEVMDGMIE